MPILLVLLSLSSLPVDHCVKTKTLESIVRSYDKREISLETAKNLVKLHCKKIVAE